MEGVTCFIRDFFKQLNICESILSDKIKSREKLIYLITKWLNLVSH
jgi:hypothetical protein